VVDDAFGEHVAVAALLTIFFGSGFDSLMTADGLATVFQPPHEKAMRATEEPPDA
jgi:hypothetical protein